MSNQKLQLLAAVSVTALALMAPANAQTTVSKDKIDALEAQINALQQELKAVRAKVNNAEKSAEKAYAATAPAAKVAAPSAPPPSGVAKMSPGNRPSICTIDGQNCIGVTARLHFDAGGYDYRPNTVNTPIQHVDDGVNARRARIGVIGNFLGDWNYALIYDFGGSSDGFASSVGCAATISDPPGGTVGCKTGLLPGGILSGIQSAYISYQGLKGAIDVPRPYMPTKGPAIPPAQVSTWGTAFEVGYMDSFWSLDEATSSNDILFLERASAQVIASNLAAGDFRSQAGARFWSDWLWLGAYATGPVSGAVHNGTNYAVPASALAPQTPSASETFGGYTRGVLHWTSPDKLYTFHIGGGAEAVFKPIQDFTQTDITKAHPLNLNDRPEIRIDPNLTLLATGSSTITDFRRAQVYNVEGAAALGPIFIQGEYFWFNIERFFHATNRFQGGYVEAAWAITGESRSYNNPVAAFNGLVPKDPFSLKGGWGAWEIAGRYSYMNLNDLLGLSTGHGGVAGGKQQVAAVGLNWYPNRNIRFMIDWLHGTIDKQKNPDGPFIDIGAKFDAVAVRSQFAF